MLLLSESCVFKKGRVYNGNIVCGLLKRSSPGCFSKALISTGTDKVAVRVFLELGKKSLCMLLCVNVLHSVCIRRLRVRSYCRASVTRRTFGHSGIAVHTWYACPALIKSIWAMAISQHQFYLDRKQSKVRQEAQTRLSRFSKQNAAVELLNDEY